MRPNNQAVRAEAVCDALHGATQARSKGSQRTRGTQRLTMMEEPRLVKDREGNVVGVEVWVELTADGVVQDIDPHRVFINPPTSLVLSPEVRDEAGNITTPRQVQRDPLAALWEVLWQQVEQYPSPETKAQPRKILR